MPDTTDRFNQLRKDFLAVDRRKEKIEFLKRYGKRIPPELLAEEKTKRDPNVNPTAKPIPPPWHQQPSRFLVCRSPGSFNILAVDRDGSCANQEHVNREWHKYTTYSKYAEARPELLAVRCPNSLSTPEWTRAFSSYFEAQVWAKANPYKPATEAREDKPTWGGE